MGVCGSDLPRILTKGAHRLPLVPGHELSGTVVAAEGGTFGRAGTPIPTEHGAGIDRTGESGFHAGGPVP